MKDVAKQEAYFACAAGCVNGIVKTSREKQSIYLSIFYKIYNNLLHSNRRNRKRGRSCEQHIVKNQLKILVKFKLHRLFPPENPNSEITRFCTSSE